MENSSVETYSDKNIITFDEGILGFENIKNYLLYQEKNSNLIWSLQAADTDTPSFVVIDPFLIIHDYNPSLSDEDLKYFDEKDLSNFCFLCIAAIKPEITDSVVNLKAPIVIDVNTRKARQVIMDNSEYPIRYKLFRTNRQEG